MSYQFISRFHFNPPSLPHQHHLIHSDPHLYYPDVLGSSLTRSISYQTKRQRVLKISLTIWREPCRLLQSISYETKRTLLVATKYLIRNKENPAGGIKVSHTKQRDPCRWLQSISNKTREPSRWLQNLPQCCS